MPREVTIPAQTVREEVRSLSEYSTAPGSPGFVTVMVGVVDDNGVFVVPQQFVTYEISGANFEALTGEPAEWAPDKPAGTYRNEDLWYFIDLIRNPVEAE
jgi:hypothetical protein